MAKKLKFNEAAALHFAAGALKSQDVPVGTHDLSGCRIIVTLPKGAAVARDVGTEGNGYDECPPKGIDLTREVALLFIERTGAADNPKAKSIFLECFRAAHDARDNVKAQPPKEMEAAAEEFFTQQPDCKGRKKTAAKRIGLDLVEVSVEKV